MVAADGDLVGLFVHPTAVGLGHAGKGAGDVVVPPHVLHQVLGHGGQAVGVLDVLVVIVPEQEGGLLAVADQRDARGVEAHLIHHALAHPGKAALAGDAGGAGPLFQRDALGVQSLAAPLADLQQDVPHHPAFDQRPDLLPGAHFPRLVLQFAQNAHVVVVPPCFCPAFAVLFPHQNDPRINRRLPTRQAAAQKCTIAAYIIIIPYPSPAFQPHFSPGRKNPKARTLVSDRRIDNISKPGRAPATNTGRPSRI